jgi:hypothetical protein
MVKVAALMAERRVAGDEYVGAEIVLVVPAVKLGDDQLVGRATRFISRS